MARVEVGRHDCCSQAIVGRIGQVDGLVYIGELHDGKHRPEDFLLPDLCMMIIVKVCSTVIKCFYTYACLE